MTQNSTPAYTLGNVPEKMITSARVLQTPYEGKVVEFNVASWLQLPGLNDLQISLLMSYQDGGQTREVQIDHGRLNAQGKVMLSGIARLPVRRALSQLRVQVRSGITLQKVLIEELFVQPVELAKTPQVQLYAAS